MLEIAGKGEGSKVSKITVECPVALVVNVKTGLLETKKTAEKGSVTLLSSVDEVKNKGNVEIKDTLPLEDSAKNEDKKEESVKDNKTEENKKNEDNSKANLGGSGASNGGSGASNGGGGASGGGGGTSGGGGSLGGGSNGSSGGGSSSTQKPATGIEFVTTDFNISKDGGIITVKVKYLPEGSTGKIKWNITGDASNNKAYVAGIVSTSDNGTIRTVETDKNTIQIKALNNGKYKLSAQLGGNVTTYIYKEGNVEGQKVKLSVGTPANYKAGDGKITGVEAGNQYILISDNKFYGVAAGGVASSGYTERELALNQTANLTVTEITGLDNSKTYTVEKIDVAKEAEKRLLAAYEAYMKDSEYNPENITFAKYDKYKELIDKGSKLLEDLDRKVKSANSDQAEWKAKFDLASKRAKAVNDKIEENKKLVVKVEQEIKNVFADIEKAGSSNYSERPDGRIAKNTIEKIDNELNKVEGIVINRFLKPEQIEIYNGVKEEITEYNKLVKGVLSFEAATKILTLPKQKVNVMYEIKKDVGEVEWRVMGAGVISADTEKFDMKALLENCGKGKYEIRVFKNFNYIKNEFIDTKIGLEVNIN